MEGDCLNLKTKFGDPPVHTMQQPGKGQGVTDDHTRKPRAAAWAALPSLLNPFMLTRPCQGLSLMPKLCKM